MPWQMAGWRAMARAALQQGHGHSSAWPSAMTSARLCLCARCAPRMHAGRAWPARGAGARGATGPPGRA
jgi:hypothetical protein